MKINSPLLNKWQVFKLELNFQKIESSSWFMFGSTSVYMTYILKYLTTNFKKIIKSFHQNILLKLEDRSNKNFLILILLRLEYYDAIKDGRVKRRGLFKTKGSQILTLGKKQELYFDLNDHKNFNNYKDIKILIETYVNYFDLFIENYNDILPLNLYISYKIVSVSKIKELMPEKELKSKIIKSKDSQIPKKEEKVTFKGYNLPNTMDFTKWGHCTISKDYTSATVIKLNKNHTKSKINYSIKIKELKIEVDYKIYNKVLFSFTDTLVINENFISKNLNYFKRTLKNKIYIYEEGKRIFILNKEMK